MTLSENMWIPWRACVLFFSKDFFSQKAAPQWCKVNTSPVSFVFPCLMLHPKCLSTSHLSFLSRIKQNQNTMNYSMTNLGTRHPKKHPVAPQSLLFLVWRESAINHKGQISHLPEQLCWLSALIALPVALTTPRGFYPTENWFRCLNSVTVRGLVFPSGHQPLTNLNIFTDLIETLLSHIPTVKVHVPEQHLVNDLLLGAVAALIQSPDKREMQNNKIQFRLYFHFKVWTYFGYSIPPN